MVVRLSAALILVAALAAIASEEQTTDGRSNSTDTPSDQTGEKYNQTDVENVKKSSDVQEPISQATTGILGSKHDFSRLTGRAIDACAVCHVPHTQAVRPRTVEDGKTVLEFYKITSEHEVFVSGRFTPGPTSLMCLSCHNGVVAPSTVGSAHALLAGQRSGFELPEGASQRDHPVGILYPNRARGYRAKSFILAEGAISLPENRVECTSCHDPHDTNRVPGMLVMSNRRSALCLACHIK